MAALDLKLEDFSEAELTTPADPKPHGLLSSLKSKIGVSRKATWYKYARTTGFTPSKVFVILRDFLQPDTTLTLESTVKAVLHLLPDNASYSDEMWSFAVVSLRIAEQIPYYHLSQIKLVSVMDEVCRSGKLTDVVPPNERVRHFHRFFEAMTDAYTGPGEEEPAAYPNIQAFFARIHEKHIHPSYPTFPIWAMRDAFEDIHKDYTFKGMLDQYILAAAQWILWDGQDLFNQVLYPENKALDYHELLDDDHHARVLAPGPLYNGKPGLSLHRWHFWRDGFKAAAEDSEHTDECRNVSKKVVSLMESLEQGMMR